jgi:hypothetical protein
MTKKDHEAIRRRLVNLAIMDAKEWCQRIRCGSLPCVYGKSVDTKWYPHTSCRIDGHNKIASAFPHARKKVWNGRFYPSIGPMHMFYEWQDFAMKWRRMGLCVETQQILDEEFREHTEQPELVIG